MYDNSLYFAKNLENEEGILTKYGVDKGEEYILVTCHRPQNTDSKEALTSIFEALNSISKEDNIKVVLPLHPRTKALMDKNVEADVLASVRENENFILGEPANFIEMIGLEKNCSMVISDSGGVQKEAFFFDKPAVIMRPETEWVEIVESGSATLAGSDGEKIKAQYKELRNKDLSYPSIFGDGKAAEFMIKEIVENL
jgi:UDP-GlcNAc3NAcA epimerase